MPERLEHLRRLKSVLVDRYIVERELGQGGMATVYLAEDVKHQRKVALKVLRPELAAVLGPDRFHREIKLTARLNHPHILALLDSGDAEGILFYVMPYAEGETLRQVLNRETQLSVDDALRYAQQVASALHYAHGQGVMHRDIKPENILLHVGEAMVADFGIALALDAAGGDRLTATGLSIGTPEYMSPEQASGAKHVDARSDVYALGCVLHEMLTGDPPFTAQSPQAIIARQVLDPAPSIRTVRPSVSAELETVVHRALMKTPADRWRTAEEFGAQLKAVALTKSGATRPRTPHKVFPGFRKPVIGIGAVMIVGTAVVLLTARFEPARVPPIAVPTQVTLTGRSSRAAISPDGAYMAFTEGTDRGQRIVVQDVGGGGGLELGLYDLVTGLDWSPNGSDLLISGVGPDERQYGTVIYSRFGGEPRRLSLDSPAAKWSPDGQRVAIWRTDIREVRLIDLVRGDSLTVLLPELVGYMFDLDWSPDGQWFAILTYDPGGPTQIWSFRIWAVAVEDISDMYEIVRDTAALAGPVWTPDGEEIYYLRRDGATADLMAIEVSDGQPVNGPDQVISDVPALNALGEYASLSPVTMSADGSRMLFARDESRANLWTVRTAPNTGPATQQTRGTGAKSYPRFSPNGDAVGYLEAARGQMDVWVDSLNGTAARRLTFDGLSKHQLAWSPTGNRLAYGARRDGKEILTIVDMDGVIDEHPETAIGADLVWPEEGTIIHNPLENNQLFRYNLTDRSSVPLLDPAGYKFSPRVSPDDERMAFHWNLSDGPDLWISEGDAGPPRRLGVGNYTPIGWDTDGMHLFAIASSGKTVYSIHTLNGVIRPVAEFPTTTDFVHMGFHENTGTVVAALTEEKVDVWMVEDFDNRRR